MYGMALSRERKLGARLRKNSKGMRALGRRYAMKEILGQVVEDEGLGGQLNRKAFAFEGEEVGEISVRLFNKAHGLPLVLKGEDLVSISVQPLERDVCPRVVWRTDEVGLGLGLDAF